VVKGTCLLRRTCSPPGVAPHPSPTTCHIKAENRLVLAQHARWPALGLHALPPGALAGTAHAEGKNMVFCSEGSPAGSLSAEYTTSTDFDAGGTSIRKHGRIRSADLAQLGPGSRVMDERPRRRTSPFHLARRQVPDHSLVRSPRANSTRGRPSVLHVSNAMIRFTDQSFQKAHPGQLPSISAISVTTRTLHRLKNATMYHGSVHACNSRAGSSCEI